MSKKTMKPVVAAVGAAFAGSMMLAGAANAAENPFGVTELNGGYMQIASSHEGKCGAGKCGAGKAEEAKCGAGKKAEEGKCGAGKCGAGKKAEEGKCGAAPKPAEGKCGAGKCGAK